MTAKDGTKRGKRETGGPAGETIEAGSGTNGPAGETAAPEATNTTPEATQAAVTAKRRDRKGRKAVANLGERLQRLTVEYLPINSLRPNAYNPNRQTEHDFELLLRSIEDDGFTQPVIVNGEGVIVDGEHRWRAAASLGMTEIPCVRVDMTPEQMRVATIRHNRARGTHDIDLEAQVLRDLQELGALDWAAGALLMDDVELNRLLDDIPAPEALAGDSFSEGWDPAKFGDEEQALLDGDAQTADEVEHPAGNASSAMTVTALNRIRERERRLAEAKTEQDRAAARRDAAVYRINMTFTAEEAEIVRSVLGRAPAQALLQLCRERLAGQK